MGHITRRRRLMTDVEKKPNISRKAGQLIDQHGINVVDIITNASGKITVKEVKAYLAAKELAAQEEE